MPKKITVQAGMPPATDLTAVSAVVGGFVPTPEQQRVKSAFWVRWGDDPLVDPENLTAAEAARRSREPDVERWFRNEACRAWFLNRESAREGVEFLLDTWIEQAASKLTSQQLGDREFLALGKLLTDLSPRFSKQEQREAPATPERMRALVEQAAKQLGWSPPPLKEIP